MINRGTAQPLAMRRAADRSTGSTTGLGTVGPPLIATLWGLALCGVGPLLATGAAYKEPMGSAAWWCVGAMVLAGGRLAFLIGLGYPRLLEMSFWIFSYVFLGVAPIIQLRSGLTPSTTPGIDHTLDTTTAIAVVVGMTSFLVGVLAPRAVPPRPVRELPVRENRVRLLAAGAVVANLYYIAKVGFSSLFSSRAEFGLLRLQIWGNPSKASLMSDLCTLPLLVAFVALLQVNHQRAAAGLPRRRLMPMLTACLALLTVNPISSPRYYFATVILGIIATLGAYATPVRVRVSTTAFLLGLMFLFPMADAFRRITDPQIALNPTGAFVSGDFDAFAQINNTLLYVDEYGSTWGHQALGLVAFWIPRGMWPDKPLDTGILLAEFRHYDFTNLSAPLWAELFINGGWPLLILGMVVIGWLVRRFDTRNSELAETGQRLSVLGYILPFYAIILLRGSMLQAMLALAGIVAPALWVTRRRPLTE